MTEVAVALIWEGGKFMICQRPARMFSGLSIVGFQFSPLRGGVLPLTEAMAINDISILAPAWGASREYTNKAGATNLFQFSPPRGGRRRMSSPASTVCTFQFSPPRGGRLHIRTKANHSLCIT